ncbi:hypothetical protein JW977_01080 [Candidatus Falkowbacteria bacterium]|nr:hypothetical protein [Candidatus Falkowbacteria bacterium]
MFISDKKLNHVRVETAGGRYLGLVQGFELDTDTGIIEKYYVKSKKLISGLFENALIINRKQIISFTDEKMIVEEAAAKALASSKKVLNQIEEINPVITSKEL